MGDTGNGRHGRCCATVTDQGCWLKAFLSQSSMLWAVLIILFQILLRIGKLQRQFKDLHRGCQLRRLLPINREENYILATYFCLEQNLRKLIAFVHDIKSKWKKFFFTTFSIKQFSLIFYIDLEYSSVTLDYTMFLLFLFKIILKAFWISQQENV